MENTKWNTFKTEKDGVAIDVKWSKKDFAASYEIGQTTLKYGLHINAGFNMEYSKEKLLDKFERNNIYASFKEAEQFINQQKDFIQNIKKEFAQTKAEQAQRLEELNRQLKELKKKFKASDLTQKDYQEHVKSIEREKQIISFYSFEKSWQIAKSIKTENGDTQHILRNYFEKLWEAIV